MNGSDEVSNKRNAKRSEKKLANKLQSRKEGKEISDKNLNKKSSKNVGTKEKSNKNVVSRDKSSKNNVNKNSSKNVNLTNKSNKSQKNFQGREASKKTIKENVEEESPSLIKGYIIHELLGEGSYSKVFRVTKRDNPREQFACKRYKINEKTRRWIDRCLTREMDIALRVNHPNVVRSLEAFYHNDEAFLILEYAPNGSIKKFVRGLPEPEYLPETKIKSWFSDMLASVAYLHGKEIAHRDIKTDNFLLDKNMKPLLCDFSFACFSPTPNTRFDCMVFTRCGTPHYLAPEVHTLKPGEKYNAKKVDAYSLGVCLFELFQKISPFRGRYEDRFELVAMQLERDYALGEEVQASDDARKLIDLMLEPNPNRRISVNRALMDDWFKVQYKKPEEKDDESACGPYHKFSKHHLEESSDASRYNRSLSVADDNSDALYPPYKGR